MGLLSFSSIYRKNKKEKVKNQEAVHLPSNPIPKLEPLLSFDLTDKPTLTTSTSTKSVEPSSQILPAGSGSLMDDIFSELKTKPVAKEDPLLNDFSLALALSQQLSLEENSTKNLATTKPNLSNNNNNNNQNKLDQSLFGADSIYSSYLRNISAIDSSSNQNYSTSNSFSTSMFDSLINKNSTNPTVMTTTTTTTTTVVTKAVLDSDVSDSEDDKKSEDESDEEENQMKGLQPIMERRGPNLSVQRKIDQWSNRVDNGGNFNESVIERMKDRHRNHVKLAALRQQQQQQQQQFGNHVVTQPYPPIMPQNNVVLPHPGLVDPAQLYYPNPTLHDYVETPPRHEYSKSLKSSRSSPNTSNIQESPNASSVTLPSVQDEEVNDPVEEPPSMDYAAEADVESCSEDEHKSIHSIKSKSSKKQQRRKSGEDLTETRKIRSSRSAPNLKKSNSSSHKKSNKSNSRSSSRRNSQDLTSSPSSEMIKTPPPLPSDDLEHLYKQKQPIRHMKSEPEISRKGQQYHQQLSSEWERIQVHQREHHMKQHYQQQFQPVVYTPVYYPVPNYSGSTLLDPHRSPSGPYSPSYPAYPPQHSFTPQQPYPPQQSFAPQQPYPPQQQPYSPYYTR